MCVCVCVCVIKYYYTKLQLNESKNYPIDSATSITFIDNLF